MASGGAINVGAHIKPDGHLSKFVEVGNNYIAQVFNISNSTASEYKKLAEKHGYIKIERNMKKIGIKPSDVKWLKEYIPDIAKRVRVLNGQVYIQETHKILPCIYFKSLTR